MIIIPFQKEHLSPLIELSLRAWEPIFQSLEAIIQPAVYAEFYPEGWQKSQKETVTAALNSDEMQSWIGMENGRLMGYVTLKFDHES